MRSTEADLSRPAPGDRMKSRKFPLRNVVVAEFLEVRRLLAAHTWTGASALVLAGTNTYDGVTSVSGGDLKVGSANALGSALGNAVVSDGGALVDQMGITCAEAVTLSGNGDGIVPGALRADQASFQG